MSGTGKKGWVPRAQISCRPKDWLTPQQPICDQTGKITFLPCLLFFSWRLQRVYFSEFSEKVFSLNSSKQPQLVPWPGIKGTSQHVASPLAQKWPHSTHGCLFSLSKQRDCGDNRRLFDRCVCQERIFKTLSGNVDKWPQTRRSHSGDVLDSGGTDLWSSKSAKVFDHNANHCVM